MLKKIAASVLALSMIASMGVTAFADAGVGFDSTDPTIIDPHNPPTDPTDPNYPDTGMDQLISSRDIDFGSQKISTKTMTYNSKTQSRTEEGKTIGILLSNADSEKYWQIRVKAAGFFTDPKDPTDPTDHGSPTMKGYTMTLKSDGNLVNNLDPSVTTATPTREDSIELRAKADGTAGDAQVVMTAGQTGSDYTVGQWGSNYYGELKVLGGTATKGNARAVITWEVNQTP